MDDLSARKVSGVFDKLVRRLRPFLCPFDQLAGYVPSGASVLDVGCGNGVFLGILAESGRICAGHGVDRSERAIHYAQQIAEATALSGLLKFETLDSLVEVPDLGYDVVSMVDVMHHIPKPAQRRFFIDAASKLRPGGTLIYKDISDKHKLWRFFNTLHDLVKAREFVHYVSEEALTVAAKEAGLERRLSFCVRKLWYMHVIEIFDRPTLPPSGAHIA